MKKTLQSVAFSCFAIFLVQQFVMPKVTAVTDFASLYQPAVQTAMAETERDSRGVSAADIPHLVKRIVNTVETGDDTGLRLAGVVSPAPEDKEREKMSLGGILSGIFQEDAASGAEYDDESGEYEEEAAVDGEAAANKSGTGLILQGTAVGEKGRIALIDGETLRPGDIIQGFTIDSIEDAVVSLKSPNGEQVRLHI